MKSWIVTIFFSIKTLFSKYSLPTIEIDLFGTKHFSDFSGRLPKAVKHRLIFCANTESELSMLSQRLKQNYGDYFRKWALSLWAEQVLSFKERKTINLASQKVMKWLRTLLWKTPAFLPFVLEVQLFRLTETLEKMFWIYQQSWINGLN